MLGFVQRHHLLHKARQVHGLAGLLHMLDRPIWMRPSGVEHPVRLRAVSHASYYLPGAHPERAVADVLFARRGGVFWDVGANFGYYTWLLGGGVMFEPDPDNAALIRQTLARLNRPGYELVEAAASDTAGEARFARDETSTMRGHIADMGISVAAARLDDRTEAPSLVKIDVEGHELAVLRGMEHKLLAHRPVVMVEQTPGRDDALRFLRYCGYRVSRIASANHLAEPL